MRLVIVSLWITLMSASVAHEYYVSVFQLNFNAKSKQIEGEVKVFADDLELLLKKKGYGVFALNNEAQRSEIEIAMAKELKSHFVYKNHNGKPEVLSFVGYEIEKDLCWIYFTVDKVKSVRNPQIEITWMTDLYDGQVNIVHFKNEDKKLSEYLNAETTSINFKFKE